MSLRPAARNRINTVYMICYFSGGSVGSLVGSAMWSSWGWVGVCGTGALCMLIAGCFLLFKVREEQPV